MLNSIATFLQNFFSSKPLYRYWEPRGWDLNREGNNTMIVCIEEAADFPPCIHLKETWDIDSQTLDQQLDTLIPELAPRKPSFELIERSVEQHAQGFFYGKLDYRFRNGEQSIREKQVLVPFCVGGRGLSILATAPEELLTKYQVIFERLIKSLRLEDSLVKANQLGAKVSFGDQLINALTKSSDEDSTPQ